MATDSASLALARACAQRMLAADRASLELGMTVEIPAAGEAVVRMTVSGAMVNGHDLCHGGYLFTLADSAFAFACNAYNRVTVSSGASIDYLRPAKNGDHLVATARELRRGRRHGLYDVAVHREDGEAIAMFRGRCVSSDRTIIDN